MHDKSIGESMQLNAAYKPPAGYKPVYKEAKLFIPVSTIAYDTYYIFYHVSQIPNSIYIHYNVFCKMFVEFFLSMDIVKMSIACSINIMSTKLLMLRRIVDLGVK